MWTWGTGVVDETAERFDRAAGVWDTACCGYLFLCFPEGACAARSTLNNVHSGHSCSPDLPFRYRCLTDLWGFEVLEVFWV
jgi:hypothetical protein